MRPYSNPYLCGIGIGLVLLSAFVVTGRGLGASGAFSSAASASVALVAPDYANANATFAPYLMEAPNSAGRDWLVWEIVGVLLGGWLSARLAGRISLKSERGNLTASRARLLYALGGGALMGVGAKFAHGCTSGLGLTGGSTLSAGSWLFIIVAFTAAFAIAPLVRKQWE